MSEPLGPTRPGEMHLPAEHYQFGEYEPPERPFARSAALAAIGILMIIGISLLLLLVTWIY